MRSSAIFLVSVVTRTRPPAPTVVWMRASRSSTCPLVGMTVTSGSTSPVGRMTCSTTCAECSSSKAPGVADTKTHWGTRSTNSSKRSGRLSLADGQPEAVLDQHVLAGAVPGVLPVQLGHGDVALVDHAEVVLGEEVQERERRLPRGPAVEVAAVVLHARADPRLGQHLEVVLRADAQALRLEQLALPLELLEPLPQLDLDACPRRAG